MSLTIFGNMKHYSEWAPVSTPRTITLADGGVEISLDPRRTESGDPCLQFEADDPRFVQGVYADMTVAEAQQLYEHLGEWLESTQ